jgi:hypothetical protein
VKSLVAATTQQFLEYASSSSSSVMHFACWCSYVKEGSTVRVMGILQRHENVLMIVPPTRPVTTGCQWLKVLLPAPIDGIILKCTESEKATGVPV